ncbi:MAG: sigma factor-like helix-turn-helix DNA-binding protein [Patescibacteria group bacterium]
MERSILDQIINNQKAEEVAKLNTIEIVNNIFSELTSRERDILTRRFGLKGNDRETLETVGRAHQLTRERVRQIEVSSIKKLRQLEKIANYIDVLKKVINQLLEEHGGLLEREYLFELLVSFSIEGSGDRQKDETIHKNHLDFLISKLLHDECEEVNNLDKFKGIYKIKYQTLSHLEEIVNELTLKIEELKKTFTTMELIDILIKLDSYTKYREKLETPNNINISKILARDLFEENEEIINNNKILYSLLRAARNIEQNKFGHWGINNWREIKPKTINDKIYLILKHFGKPMHFIQIADRINQINFDKKKANAATVHNELILDKKYVLVGRGIYGLMDWGFKRGTVADVIREILSAENEPMKRDEIIDKVLAKRLVKKTTIILSLLNKDIFVKANGKYSLKKENGEQGENEKKNLE